jgi:hypothetical protein
MQTNTRNNHDPRLSEILPPVFTTCDEQDVGDAMLWWGYLTGKLKQNWAQPSKAIPIEPHTYGSLRVAAQGLVTVARLSQIIRNSGTASDGKTAPWLSSGLDAALCALAEVIDTQLSEEQWRTDKS